MWMENVKMVSPALVFILEKSADFGKIGNVSKETNALSNIQFSIMYPWKSTLNIKK